MLDEAVAQLETAKILEEYKSMTGNLLPILHAIQNTFDYVPQFVIPQIAESLNLSAAEVHGVVTFYHYFRTIPPGKTIIKVCRAESCQAMNGNQLAEHVKKTLGINWHETDRNGQFTLEPVYCLGNCACSPALTIKNDIYGRVTPKQFDELIESYQGDSI